MVGKYAVCLSAFFFSKRSYQKIAVVLTPDSERFTILGFFFILMNQNCNIFYNYIPWRNT
jgi:hypothetical protein